MIDHVSSYGQCAGYEYSVNYDIDVPPNFIFEISYRLVAKTSSSEYSTVGIEGQKVALIIRDKCNQNTSIRLEILDKDKKVVSTNKSRSGKLEDTLYFTYPELGIYYFRFTYNTEECWCGYAVLSVANKKKNKLELPTKTRQ